LPPSISTEKLMKTQRISIVLSAATIFFVTSVISSLCVAQQIQAPVQSFAQVETQASPQLYPKRSIHHDGILNSDSLPFYIVRLDSVWADVSNGNEYTYSCEVYNTTSNPLTIYFLRSQQLPFAWVTSVCWGTTCYADSVTSESYTIPPNGSAGLQLNVTPVLTDYSDTSKVWLRVGVVDSIADTVQLPFYSSFRPGNPPIIFQWSGTPIFQYAFNGSGNHTLTNNILVNRAGVSTKYYFSMQDSLPDGWSAQYCISSNCTSEAKDSSVFEPYGDVSLSGYEQRVKFNLIEPVLLKKDSAIFYLSIHPSTENPADSANYRFVAVVNTHLLNPVTNLPVTGGSPDTITAQFENLLTVADGYHFSLRTMLPTGWSLENYCVGDSCSSGSDIISPFDANGGAKANQNVVFALNTQASARIDTGILYLSSYPIDNPGDLRIDTLYAVTNPQSGVSTNSDVTTAGLAVTNVWPNPVYGSGKLTLDILTDRAGACLARIYDIAGIEQATVDLGTLRVGENEVQIANPNLHSGEYIIRIEQGNDASEVIRINYIR
jgi:hypothetical protein